MHMADSLLSPSVGMAMGAVSLGAIAYSVHKINKGEFSEKKLPLMAVSGAFVFAAQMINFTIPATGSSGHIGGGILLAGLLGSYPALLTIAAVLAIQCLLFADGGLLALGCNIFNMGVIPCFVIYPLIYKIATRKMSVKNILSGSFLSVLIGLPLGAFCVVLETLISGITQLPFTAFTALMIPIHIAIGAVEGIITALVLSYVYKMRPEILENATGTIDKNISVKKPVVALAVITLIVGGVVSMFASQYPDGLEWSIENITGNTEIESNGNVYKAVEDIQSKTAFLPDYDYISSGDEGSATGTTVSGIVGSCITFVFAGAIGFVLWKVKKSKVTE